MKYNDPEDIHCAAVIIKRFLRELPEPILTFRLYDTVVTSTCKYLVSFLFKKGFLTKQKLEQC